MSNADEETAVLHRLASRYAGRPVGVDEVLHQDTGLNGADSVDLLANIPEHFPLPWSDWARFADTSEPPNGLRLFARLRILPRERLTHLAGVIHEGRWRDPPP